MSKCKARKSGLNKEILNKFSQIMLKGSIEDNIGKVFTKQNLEDNQALESFEKNNFAEELRKYIKVSDLRLLSKRNDGKRTLQNILDMFRHCVKKMGYTFTWYYKQVKGERFVEYTIFKQVQN